MMTYRRTPIGLAVLSILALGQLTNANDDTKPLSLSMRSRSEIAPGTRRFREVHSNVQWKAAETAIVICDMWNNHYCRNAARRVAEMAPRMNAVLNAARKQGVLIIHSPSGCMDKYADMPQRKLAQQAPPIKTTIPLKGWCYRDEKREAPLPVAVSQPCDDDGITRPAVRYFNRQIETLEIQDGDAITDSAEAFYLMKQRGIKNVIVMGVHTNMCVLGRPFGIRQMVYQGQNVALMRDLTDTMYNPRDEPYVDHFTGNDLIFEHIERYWCPTITSADFLGGKPFRFPGDRRPRLAIVMAEKEYDTAQTLPPFALKHLGGHFKITCIYADQGDRNSIPGLHALDQADVAIWSIRRRTLPTAQLDVFRRFIAAGKPLVALRTTSHAFSLREGQPQSGLAQWAEFDQDVLGGNYHDHHPGSLKTFVTSAEGMTGHPILKGVRPSEFRVFGSLYKNEPILDTAAPLMFGRAESIEGKEPVAWTHQRPNRGRVFYTSLGHPRDFEIEDFCTMLRNAVYWAAKLPVPPADQPTDAKTADAGC